MHFNILTKVELNFDKYLRYTLTVYLLKIKTQTCALGSAEQNT